MREIVRVAAPVTVLAMVLAVAVVDVVGAVARLES